MSTDAYMTADHQLAQAIWEHEAELLSDPDVGPADRELWAKLDQIARPDGATVRNWMDNHKAKGAA